MASRAGSHAERAFAVWNPVTALVWESWRLTRLRMAFLLAIVLVAGWAVLTAIGSRGDGVAGMLVLVLAMLLSILAGLSMALVGARGFPFSMSFARSISSRLLVAVPLIYLGVASAALYLVPISVLGMRFDVPFPLAPVAAGVAAGTMASAACCWWTRSMTLRSLSLVAAYLASGFIVRLVAPDHLPSNSFSPEHWPQTFDLSLADYGLIGLVVVTVYLAAVLGVERQRRGDGEVGSTEARQSSLARAVPNWSTAEIVRDGLASVVRLPCPTSSPTRAQLWLELKCRGLPVLAIGLLLAAGIPGLLALAYWYSWAPAIPLALASFIAPFVAGICATIWTRRSPWRIRMSAFEATRALGAGRLAGLEVLMTAVSVLGAWIIIGASFWLSLPLIGETRGFGPLTAALARLDALSLTSLTVLSVAGLVFFATTIAFLVSMKHLSALYGKRLYVVALALTVYLLALALAVALDGIGVGAVGVHLWIVALAIPLGTALVFRRVLAERVLARAHAVAALAGWAGFAAVYLVFLRQSGVVLSDLPPATAALFLSLGLLPLTIVALAPWSLALNRHS